MNVDADTPVPLILDSLRSNMGWKVLEERLQLVRDGYNRMLITAKATEDPRQVQRWLGIMEGLDRVLRDPMMLEREWKAARQAQEKRNAAERLRAANANVDG